MQSIIAVFSAVVNGEMQGGAARPASGAGPSLTLALREILERLLDYSELELSNKLGEDHMRPMLQELDPYR
jgi:hypothetical protein